MFGTSNFWPAMAVPMTVKIPEPMTAPIPSAVSDHGPRDFFKECPGSSESRINLSMDLRATSWLSRGDSPGPAVGGFLGFAGSCRSTGGAPAQDPFDRVYRVRVSPWNSSLFRKGPGG